MTVTILVDETGVPAENHTPVANYCQALYTKKNLTEMRR
jgi:hypothetical protein